MSSLAPTLEAFFSDRLINQRRVSAFTVEAYRDTFRLLLRFIYLRTGKAPSKLGIDDLDATMIGAFLEHLEQDRGNRVRTRNARLAALHSFFRFASFRHPEHAALIQRVLAIPHKRYDRALVTFLTPQEVAALIAAANPSTWTGRRDHALLVLAVQTGLRVSEVTKLMCQDVHLDAGAHVRCHGKGRKQRITPLTAQTAAVLRVWIHERHGRPDDPLFPTSRGRPLSTDAIALLIGKYAAAAENSCPSLRAKQVSPHVLRHTCAMQLLQAGVDTSVIALWLGHEQLQTTQIYLHADLSLKERALARTAPPSVETPARYRPPDTLLAFLESL
ncbi:MAG: tyrosine-type recombinase/integrase [Chloroflexi bacterium]|nr:tyrosine-type recombinase/integrase [Chloroflexota bacterium]MBV9547516.1 tyrosine-type recombinase/integrase [Chloroflexota bacterium]